MIGVLVTTTYTYEGTVEVKEAWHPWPGATVADVIADPRFDECRHGRTKVTAHDVVGLSPSEPVMHVRTETIVYECDLLGYAERSLFTGTIDAWASWRNLREYPEAAKV